MGNSKNRDTRYNWFYNPKKYPPETLTLLTKFLKDGINIKKIEVLNLTHVQIEALWYAHQKGCNINQFLSFQIMPSTGIIRFIADNHPKYPTLIKYFESGMDLPTMRWVTTWISTPNELELSKFLLHNLDWAQLNVLTKMYMKFKASYDLGQNYIDPRKFLTNAPDFKTLTHLLKIYETQGIDLSEYLTVWTASQIKHRFEAIDLGVPKEFFDIQTITPENEADRTLDILFLIDTYSTESIKEFISKLAKLKSDTKLNKVLSRAVAMCKLNNKNPWLFKNLNSAMSSKYIGL